MTEQPLIAFDSQIYLGTEIFGRLGRLKPLADKEINPENLKDADALAVRSTLKVGAPLLAGTRVRFVGTCTAGNDHLDIPGLRAMGVTTASAPGCNADSVSCYIACALFGLRKRGKLRLEGASLGIIGRGAIGGRVAAWARAAGLKVVACDPPRKRQGEADLHPLEEALACDLVTLHVPFTREGVDRTEGLLSAARLAAMKPGAWLFNTSRGGIVDEEALKQALQEGRLGGAVVDTWAGEPFPDLDLAALCALATPHIAGHSLDGKAGGTRMIAEAMAAWMGLAKPAPPASLSAGPSIYLSSASSPLDGAASCLDKLYDPWLDDAVFRNVIAVVPAEAIAFRHYRQNYPARRDPAAARVHLDPGTQACASLLKALGFRLSPDPIQE